MLQVRAGLEATEAADSSALTRERSWKLQVGNGGVPGPHVRGTYYGNRGASGEGCEGGASIRGVAVWSSAPPLGTPSLTLLPILLLQMPLPVALQSRLAKRGLLKHVEPGEPPPHAHKAIADASRWEWGAPGWREGCRLG